MTGHRSPDLWALRATQRRVRHECGDWEARIELYAIALPLPPAALGLNGRVSPHERARLTARRTRRGKNARTDAENDRIGATEYGSLGGALNAPRRDVGRVSSAVTSVYQLPLFPRKGPYTAAEAAIVERLYRTHTYGDIAAILARTEKSVREFRYEHGLDCKMSPRWNSIDDTQVLAWYEEHKGHDLELSILAAQLGRAETAIRDRATKIGAHHVRVLWINGRRPCEVPKYATDEERRQALSKIRTEFMRRRWKDPGFRERQTAVLRVASRGGEPRLRQWQAATSPEQRSAIARRAVQTRLERYGTAGPVNVGNPYSHARRGIRSDLGFFVRSMWEANYARYLKWLQAQGEIASWEYEPQTFIFPGVTRNPLSYTPDFKVVERDGSVAYHEIKGWMDPKSKSKLRRMAKFYPEVKIIVVDEESYYDIAGKIGPAIAGWERDDRSKIAKARRL